MLGRAKSNLGPTGGIVKYRLYVHEFYNEHGDLIDTAILEREAYDPDSNIGLELAKGADGTAADAPMQRRDALLKYIGEYGPRGRRRLVHRVPRGYRAPDGRGHQAATGAGRHRVTRDHQDHRGQHDRPYTKGEYVHRVRSDEPW